MVVRPFPGCRKYLSYAPDEFDAMVFSCGDAIPQFAQHANEPYNQDLIGHCAGAMLFDMAGVIDGKTIAVHPLAKSAIQKGKATDNKSEADGNIYTAQDENSIWTMMSQVLEALK